MTQDIKQTSFWHKILPLRPYAMLARWDRPIGIWLLYWPCVWSLAMSPTFRGSSLVEQVYYLILFLIGAIVMRGAGCTINDIWDRKLDAKVARTQNRPLANGDLKVWQAAVFLVIQSVIGAFILFQLSTLAIILGLGTIPLIILYPYMKRITWWPQVFLGLVFNAGALIAWAAMENTIGLSAVFLYVGGIFWTVAYDTVYAHLDSADDALIGIKSTARKWGPDSKMWVGWSWVAAMLCFLLALFIAGTTWVGYLMFALSLTSLMLGHVYWNPLNSRYTLGFFQLQAKIGFLLALAALAPVLL